MANEVRRKIDDLFRRLCKEPDSLTDEDRQIMKLAYWDNQAWGDAAEKDNAALRELLGKCEKWIDKLTVCYPIDYSKPYQGGSVAGKLKVFKTKLTAALEPTRSPESLAHEATADAIREEK